MKYRIYHEVRDGKIIWYIRKYLGKFLTVNLWETLDAHFKSREEAEDFIQKLREA